MTRMLARLTVLAVVLLLLHVGQAGPVDAARLEEHGWWWRTQTGLAGVTLPAPDAPEDGLVVEATPEGPTAVAAVRFRLDEDETAPRLTLTVAGEQGGEAATLRACPATTYWESAQAGRWDQAPEADCEQAQAEGVRAEDGTTWTWELSGVAGDDGIVDVVLVPGATPFRVTFEAPTDNTSLETSRGGGDTDVVVPPPPSSPPAPASGGVGGTPGTSAPTSSGPAPSVGSADVPGASSSGEPPPQVATPDQDGPSAPAAPAAAGDAATPRQAAVQTADPGLSNLQVAALTLLASWILFDLFQRGALTALPWRRDEDESVEGGLDRFRRSRFEPPPPLR